MTEREWQVRRPDWFWLTGNAFLLLGLAAAVGVSEAEVQVVGDVVLRRWYAPGLLVGLGLTGLGVSWTRRLIAWRGRPASVHGWLWSIGCAVFTTCSVVASTYAFLVLALLDSTTSYLILSPPSPNGCRVLVAHRSGMDGWTREVSVLAAGEHLPRLAERDDPEGGAWAIKSWTYRLRWRGDVADLSVSHSGSPAGSRDFATLRCRRPGPR